MRVFEQAKVAPPWRLAIPASLKSGTIVRARKTLDVFACQRRVIRR